MTYGRETRDTKKAVRERVKHILIKFDCPKYKNYFFTGFLMNHTNSAKSLRNMVESMPKRLEDTIRR
jgi:hypothetical protein